MGRTIDDGQNTPEETVTIIDNRSGRSYVVPIKNNSIPATALKPMNILSYDPGFLNTAVIESKITFIDGDKGILRYRGYPIEEIAAKSNFIETAYLLLYGNLPSPRQYSKFNREISHHSYVHTDIEAIVASFRYDSHPMAIMQGGLSALGALAPEASPALQGQNLYTLAATGDKAAMRNLDKQIFRIIGKTITLAAMAYRIRQGRHFNRPKPGLEYVEQFLYLLDHLNQDGYKPHPTLVRALDILFILHADHELNCSTATVLQVGSSLVDPYSALSAATAALFGPLHGGANQAVIQMLEQIGTVENVPGFIEKVKNKQAVLSGFGHRIYKTQDPRGAIVNTLLDEVFAVTGKDNLLNVAMALRDHALKDEYFIKRHLFPNIDFTTGLIYRAMGFPPDYFTVLFVVPRIVGYLAHWRQQILQVPTPKIWRPRQIYIGEEKRSYVPIIERQENNTEPPNAPAIVDHPTSKRDMLAAYAGNRQSKL